MALIQGAGVLLVVPGYAHQPSVGVVAPGVEGTGEDQGVAFVVPAHLFAPVHAGVEENMQLFVFAVAGYDDLLFSHAGDEEVAGIGDHTFVGDKQPTPGEDLLHLLFIDLRVDVDLPVHHSPFNINQGP